jgi:eukaryotic-like serine/threonine-protein kinase
MQAGLKLSGRYALQALLGSGGMGEVWSGNDEQLDRPVAIKLLQEHLVDPELGRRFLREARIMGRCWMLHRNAAADCQAVSMSNRWNGLD